jgi:hypothetical protein
MTDHFRLWHFSDVGDQADGVGSSGERTSHMLEWGDGFAVINDILEPTAPTQWRRMGANLQD